MTRERRIVRVPVIERDQQIEFFEGVWAEKIDDRTFKLDNIPFYAFGLSYTDIVEVGADSVMVRVVRHSGHSTYRVKMSPSKDLSDFEKAWPELEKLGCSFEGTTREEQLYAIDVPDGRNVRAVYDVLQRHEELGLWEFEEGNYSDNG